jgi:hypothetical protein
MTITKHVCLDGDPRLGDELDCEVCRQLLIFAFREPAGIPEERSRPSTDADPEHEISTDTVPHVTTPGGWWAASCSCGWKAFGQYSRTDGEPVAARLADLRGEQHLKDPDRKCSYCNNPHRLAMCTFCADDVRHGRG